MRDRTASAHFLHGNRHRDPRARLLYFGFSAIFREVNDRISIHPKICHGQACITGTRIPVYQIVRMFAHGDSIETLLAAYSPITREDILACLDYAASLAEEQVTPLDDVIVTR